MKSGALVAAAAAFVLGPAHDAGAQSIDYGSLEQLFNEPVTTSATGSPQRATDAPVDMTIVTADAIKRSGATDLPTILSRVAGVDVLNWGAGQSDLSVRGYDQAYSPRLLVLINGREVYLDDFGYTAWSNLPVTLSEIRQIEVVRGPNSALFGFNAVGGVINIITYDPQYDTANDLEVHGGTQSNVGGSGVGTVHIGDRLSVRLSAGGERQDEWRNSADLPAAWNAHSMFDAVAKLAPETELRLEGSLSRSAANDLIPVFNVYTVGTVYQSSSIKAALSSETPFGAFQAQAYLNSLHFRTPIQIGNVDIKNQMEVVSVQDLFKIGTQNTFRVALEYRDNRENTTPLNSGHIGYGVWAPSAMWNFAASDKLSLTAAGRLDSMQLRRTGPYPVGFPFNKGDWNRTVDAFSVNLGAVYKPTELDTLRATYARGIQIPTLVEYGGGQAVVAPGPFGLVLSGNPALQPAVISNYELSYDRSVPALGLTATAKVFFQETDGVKGNWDLSAPLLPTPTSAAAAIYKNAADSRMTGFELSAAGKLDNGFHWSADTTYTHVTDKAFAGFRLMTRQIDFAKTTPEFRGNVAFGWSDAHWAADVYLHYVTAYDAYTPTDAFVSTPAYVTLAGRIGYEISNGLVIAVSGQNLTTQSQAQGTPLGLRAPRRVLVSLSKNW